MTFDEFSQCVSAARLSARDCGDGHWQIRGGKYVVNFYPDTRRGSTMFVNGMHRGRCRATIEKAIAATKQPPSPSGQQAERWNQKRRLRLRRRLFRSDPHCYWCHVRLLLREATLDHVIPLSKDGSNSQDNQVLACDACNQDRKNKLPTRTRWQPALDAPAGTETVK